MINKISTDYTGKPFYGTLQAIPGTIEAFTYDIAPNDQPEITFHYSGKYSTSSFRKGNDSMGIGSLDNSHLMTDGKKPNPPEGSYLGWTQDGEWAKYSVKVTATATYIVGGQFASAGKDSKISLTFSPTLTTGAMDIPTTDGFQPETEVYHVWEKLDNMKEITLPKGSYVMTLKLEKASGLNVKNITFTQKP